MCIIICFLLMFSVLVSVGRISDCYWLLVWIF